MRAREIADMDVVADAGAVRRRIVGAEHVDLGPLAERRFAGDLDQMGRCRARLPGAVWGVAKSGAWAGRHSLRRPKGLEPLPVVTKESIDRSDPQKADPV